MFDNPGFILFVIAVLLVLGWYAWGTQYNVRRGNRALKWLQQGLPVVGDKTTFRWLGSSVVELKLEHAREPFRTFEVMVVLEPRDIPIFWALGRMEGRRDLIILRSQLVRAPGFDVEARGRTSWKAASAKRDPSGAWISLDGQVDGLLAEYRGEVTPGSVTELLRGVDLTGLQVTRFTLSRSVPNLELHFLFPDMESVSSRLLLARLAEFGRAVLKK